MITFITAIYPEARELIRKLHLKQQVSETLYPLFEGDGFRLLITGTGMISTAATVARHFTRYPSECAQDIVINLGVAGYVAPQEASASVGDLFLVSKITEQCTGRTFYPDLLYQNSFRHKPLTTVPAVCTNPAAFTEETLIDMEASALYQTLLPHVSPDRMLFFKIISDIPGTQSAAPVLPESLLEPHIDGILSYAKELHHLLKTAAVTEPALTAEELTLSQHIAKQLPMTEAMVREYKRLLTYAKLSGKPLAALLQDFLSTISGLTIRGKKQAMPYLSRLRELILNEETIETETAVFSFCDLAPQKLYKPFFATVYAEREVWNQKWQQTFSATPILIDHYKDIFNRSHQNFIAQKKAPSLILAKKTGTLIYQGAPVCQSFGQEHFYYTSCMMNCIYHCDYCYLQGMYPSGHVVVFVNLEDYFTELETLLAKHPVYLCISYDTDLLALEHTFSFVSRWLSFAKDHPDLTLEIRTKSGNPAIFQQLAEIFNKAKALKEHIIFAWTVSPEGICKSTEHGAASLALRLKALLAAKEAGFSVRLCFDPMIFHSGWKQKYSTLADEVFATIPAAYLYDVSIGVFRISTDYLKNMRKKRPDSAIVQYPYLTENGVSHYGTLSEEMVHYLQNLLLAHLPAEKIFIWNGEI